MGTIIPGALMGAPDLARIQRELGAPLRTFRDHGEEPAVVVALRWFARVNAGPAPLRAIPLEAGPGPSSAAHRAETQATHAAMLCAMKGLQHAQARRDRKGRARPPLVVEWVMSYFSEEDMARNEGFPSRNSFRAAMHWTLRTLRERMAERGLIR